MNQQYKRIFIELAALVLLISMVYSLKFDAMARAGVITPTGSTTPTMFNASNIYDVLVGSNFNSATATPSINGNVIQVTKCIILHVEGGSCQ